MTNAKARFNKSLCPQKPEGSLGRTSQDVHLNSHTAPELWTDSKEHLVNMTETQSANFGGIPFCQATKQHLTTVKWLKAMKNEIKKEITYLFLFELLFSYPVLGSSKHWTRKNEKKTQSFVCLVSQHWQKAFPRFLFLLFSWFMPNSHQYESCQSA